ncbi:MAG: hypothetical protein PHG64_00905 [Paludibacter sp.]|nr:hypothetical protein [Paludibacter sp.]
METKNNMNANPNDMNLVERVQAPTPKFFKTLRNIGLTLAAVGGVLLTAPIALPSTVIAIAGYVALAGGVMTAISQIAVDSDNNQPNENEAP